MDLGEFRSFVLDSGIDVWTWIDLSISMASSDYENELKNKRDGIIQKLYAQPLVSKCQNCCDHVKKELNIEYNNTEILQNDEKMVVVGNEENDQVEEKEDEEQKKVLEIRFLLDDQNQNEPSLINLLQKLVNLEITFQVLKETDIGRHVTQFRKHTSTEVRRLVKILVRKWKDIVDEWVRMNSPMEELVQPNDDGESAQESRYKNNHQNGVNGYANSPYNLTPQQFHVQQGKVKAKRVESDNHPATKRIYSDHQEDQHGKKPRTGQVVNFQHIPKAKTTLVTTSNRGSVPVKY